MKIKPLVCPCDDSERPRAGLVQAAALARSFGAAGRDAGLLERARRGTLEVHLQHLWAIHRFARLRCDDDRR